ncbi:MAG: lytic transglycosylase protein [Subtercola sp.]|jgi:septal ring factor EnvC (AmiA/AmiB activator)|nr:lytic transglycosylase protein [Subtercola sp.]
MTRSARLLAAAVLSVAAALASPLTANAAPETSNAAANGARGLSGANALASAPIILTDYPSWDDVNAAKQNEAAKQAEVDNINSLLTSLETQAAQLGNEAVKKGNDYLKAAAELQAATQVSDTANQRASDAETKATAAKQQVGQLAASLYRSGGDSSAALLLAGGNADSLLYQLGTMSKLTQQSAQLNEIATSSQNLATSLQNQATVAETARQSLAVAAQQAADDAKAAQEAADAQVVDQKAKSDVLYAQLATLQNSTAQVEEAYRQGQIQAAAIAAAQAASAAAAAASSGSGSDSGSGSSEGLPPGSIVVDPAAAKAYAAGQVSAMGWGSDQFSCLVSLWTRESGWRVNAYNQDSGSYGIPQSLPADKMSSAGSDWRTNAQTQINWGLSYIKGVYGTPCGAWAHSQNTNPHWY